MTYLQRPWHSKNSYYSILSLQQSRDYNSTKKKVSLLVSSRGILHYSVTTVPCWRLRGVSGERLKHAQVQAICQLPDRTDGLDCTELSVLSAIWCYLWFSEADTFRYMSFPSGRTKSTFWIPAGCYTCRRRSLKTRRSARAVHSSGTAGIDSFFLEPIAGCGRAAGLPSSGTGEPFSRSSWVWVHQAWRHWLKPLKQLFF